MQENTCSPDQFSPEQLRMITEGKLKDGDKVFVECYEIPNYVIGMSPTGLKHHENFEYQITLTNRFITLIEEEKEELDATKGRLNELQEEVKRLKQSLNKIDNLIGNYMHNDEVKIGTLLLDIQEIAVKT